jgi:hypothetical protein
MYYPNFHHLFGPFFRKIQQMNNMGKFKCPSKHKSVDVHLKPPDSREWDRPLSLKKIGILDAAAVDNAGKWLGFGRLIGFGATCYFSSEM